MHSPAPDQSQSPGILSFHLNITKKTISWYPLTFLYKTTWISLKEQKILKTSSPHSPLFPKPIHFPWTTISMSDQKNIETAEKAIYGGFYRWKSNKKSKIKKKDCRVSQPQLHSISTCAFITKPFGIDVHPNTLSLPLYRYHSPDYIIYLFIFIPISITEIR